jgi:2-keto-3-deoxy-L-rhamnonate aldolase RhmA
MNTPVLRNQLAATLRSGGVGLGLLVRVVTEPELALAARTCGWDAINIDLQHSAIPDEAAARLCLAALGAGVTPIARMPGLDPSHIARILDCGALGVVIPDVDTPEQARAAVRAARFRPLGERSVANSWPHFGFANLPAEEMRETLNRETLVAVMVESPAAIENVDAIAAVDGVDILHIGTNDYAEACSIRGDFGHPKIFDAYQRLIAACQRHGKIPGVGGLAGEQELIARVIAMGARFLTAGNEWGLMMQAMKQRVAALRAVADRVRSA